MAYFTADVDGASHLLYDLFTDVEAKPGAPLISLFVLG